MKKIIITIITIYQTPKSKHLIQKITSPNSYSNSILQIFQSYYPQKISFVKQWKKRCNQVCSFYLSDIQFYHQILILSLQNILLNFKFIIKEIKLLIMNIVYQIQNHRQQYQIKQNYFIHQLMSFKNIKQCEQLFYFSNSLFLAFFSYSDQKVPYCLFITRQDALNIQLQKLQFLEQNQIESIFIGIDIS
ncbi:unnamed protein product [Paramecium primaurelia]|uniref:Uncharacterized protein n=1 Tax=Paramecium primaurelia TaxID=5886 RepID=A0A8S1JYG7_PARPR|nr:unnamed protein product [Paramecium primaurelia]